MWIDAHEGEANSVFPFRLSEPAQRVHAVTKQAIDNRDLISSNPFHLASRQNLFQDGPSFIVSADSSQQVGQLRSRGWRIAGKAALLFKCCKRLAMHSLLFIRPTQNGVRGHRARIQFKRLVTLLDGVIVPARQEEHIGQRRCDHWRPRRNLARVFDLDRRFIVTAYGRKTVSVPAMCDLVTRL